MPELPRHYFAVADQLVHDCAEPCPAVQRQRLGLALSVDRPMARRHDPMIRAIRLAAFVWCVVATVVGFAALAIASRCDDAQEGLS